WTRKSRAPLTSRVTANTTTYRAAGSTDKGHLLGGAWPGRRQPCAAALHDRRKSWEPPPRNPGGRKEKARGCLTRGPAKDLGETAGGPLTPPSGGSTASGTPTAGSSSRPSRRAAPWKWAWTSTGSYPSRRGPAPLAPCGGNRSRPARPGKP